MNEFYPFNLQIMILASVIMENQWQEPCGAKMEKRTGL